MKPERWPDDVPRDLLEIFLRSVRESLDRMDECLCRNPGGRGDIRLLQRLHRLTHNLKGASRQLGFLEMGDLAEAMESAAVRLVQYANWAPGRCEPGRADVAAEVDRELLAEAARAAPGDGDRGALSESGRDREACAREAREALAEAEREALAATDMAVKAEGAAELLVEAVALFRVMLDGVESGEPSPDPGPLCDRFERNGR